MSAEYDHLAPECREEADLPPLERIRRIQAERWIGYPRAELVLNRLNECCIIPSEIGCHACCTARNQWRAVNRANRGN